MCGIAGYLNLNGKPASEVLLQSMTDAISHRGPDGEGHYVNGEVAIGHRRLAIIDLTPAGHQPMITSDNRYVLSYNGEIYNFKKLRAELESRGHRFHSSTDSEVVLHGFAEWGIDVVHRLNGMFAFTIWDNVDQTVWLARDRYGIKPLYYFSTKDTFLFGSEIKSFIPHPKFSIKVNHAALIEYFTFQNFFTDNTLYDNVNILPAGNWMSVDNRGQIRVQQYWDFEFSEREIDWDAAIEETERLFYQAVSRQLVADVPLGVYLSGGMDSGSITMAASREMKDLTSFTIGFDLHSATGVEQRYDERENAEYLSYLAGTEHYEMVLKAGDMERSIADLVWHVEEPRVGQCYPNYYACRLSSKFVKVILAGIGGDELFGGYPWRYFRTSNSETFSEYIKDYYAYWQRLIPNKKLWQIFSPIKEVAGHVWTEDIFRNIYKDSSERNLNPRELVNLSLYMEAKTFLHGLLVIEDKLSMAHSLEARVPFLDNDLVDFVQKLPVSFKIKDIEHSRKLDENLSVRKRDIYYQQTHDGKLLLREVLAKILPEKFTTARKQGFSAPDGSWFKGESIDYVKDRLYSKRALIYDYMDPRPVQEMLDDHLEGRTNRRLLIWSLLYFEEWLAQFTAPGHAIH